MICNGLQNLLVDVAFEIGRRHTKLHAFANRIMGVACRMYACSQIVKWECVLQQLVAKDQQKGLVAVQSHSRLFINIYRSHIL